MPMYEYGCENCGKITEMIQKFSDEPLKDCPECGAPVQKLMSRTSFQLKGTGWYTTDYKKKSGPAPVVAPAAGGTASMETGGVPAGNSGISSSSGSSAAGGSPSTGGNSGNSSAASASSSGKSSGGNSTGSSSGNPSSAAASSGTASSKPSSSS